MIKKGIATVMALATMVSLFSACATTCPKRLDYASSKSLVLCIQQTANTAAPMLGDSEVSTLVYDTVRSSGTTTIIEVDGDSYTVDKITSDIATSLSEAKKASIAKQITKQILSIADAAVPKTAEVDVLGGLIEAARNLDKSCDEKTVLYLGSALQTAGYLPFASQNLFDADTNDIISQLTEMDAIPQFPEGTRVMFAGVGDTAAPQDDLSYTQVAKLKGIMQAICEAGGASVEFITSTPLSDANTADFPHVSTVTVYEDYVSGGAITGPLKIDPTQISFVANSYKIKDKAAAKSFLKPYVQSINATDEVIYICGTTATVGSNESCIEFSQMRAQAVCQLLCEMGVDPSRLVPIGLGYDNRFHVPDIDGNGSLNNDAAQKNRLVLIIPESCNEAAKLKR